MIRYKKANPTVSLHTNLYTTLQFKLADRCFLRASAGFLQARTAVGERKDGFTSNLGIRYYI